MWGQIKEETDINPEDISKTKVANEKAEGTTRKLLVKMYRGAIWMFLVQNWMTNKKRMDVKMKRIATTVWAETRTTIDKFAHYPSTHSTEPPELIVLCKGDLYE